jgi:hypothetical protein
MESASWRTIFAVGRSQAELCKAYAVAIPGRPELPTYRLRTAFFVPGPLMAALRHKRPVLR